MTSNKIKILIDYVFNIRSIPNIEENIVIGVNNFLQVTLNNLDKINHETILNKFFLVLLHEVDNLKTDDSKISILNIAYAPIICNEKYTDELIDFIIYLYSKYESFRKSFNDGHDGKSHLIIDYLMNKEKYIDFIFEISIHNDYARRIIIHKYINKNKLTLKQKQIILKYITEDFDRFNDVIPTEEDIEFIIKRNNVKNENCDLYKFLVENGKIIPSVKHLEIACKSLSTDYYTNDKLIIYIMDHKVFPNRKCLESIINTKMNNDEDDVISLACKSNSVFKRIINVFYDLGIEFTKDDMVKLAYKKICIENFKDYDLLTTETFIMCIFRKFYPPYICKYKLDIICYYYIFSHIKINTLPDYVQELLFNCDLTCLRLASGIHDNLETIKFILGKNINADIKTIHEIIGDDYCVELKDLLRNYK
jgi:hypothetical protein